LRWKGLDKVSKEYEMGTDKEYKINEKLKKTKKEDLDWSIGKWTYYQRRENMTGGPRYMLGAYQNHITPTPTLALG